MDLIVGSVEKIRELIDNCGCEEGDIVLRTDPDIVNCQYERGACMVATFGGKTAQFVTDNPVSALTKLSFLFGAPLEVPQARSAAAAVVNVLAGFFSLSRVQHACPRRDHMACREELKAVLNGKRIFCTGDMQVIPAEFSGMVAGSPDDADIILFNGEGTISPGAGDIVAAVRGKKEILCLGPSTSGVARLNSLSHWCPYGS